MGAVELLVLSLFTLADILVILPSGGDGDLVVIPLCKLIFGIDYLNCSTEKFIIVARPVLMPP